MKVISTHDGFCGACGKTVAQTSSDCGSCGARYARPLGWIGAAIVLFTAAFVIAFSAFEIGPVLGAAARDAFQLDTGTYEMVTSAAAGGIFFGLGSLLLGRIKRWTTYRWQTKA